jgi:hypothetical protein
LFYINVTISRHRVAAVLLPHVPAILELVQRCLSDEERSDSITRASFGIIGDLADIFNSGQIRQLLLAEWLANELRSRARLPAETKKTLRWAREVRGPYMLMFYISITLSPQMVKRATS